MGGLDEIFRRTKKLPKQQLINVRSDRAHHLDVEILKTFFIIAQ